MYSVFYPVSSSKSAKGCACVVVFSWLQEKPDPLEVDPEKADVVQMGRLRNTASKLFQLNQALQQLHSSLSRTLRGRSFFSPAVLTLIYFYVSS